MKTWTYTDDMQEVIELEWSTDGRESQIEGEAAMKGEEREGGQAGGEEN